MPRTLLRLSNPESLGPRRGRSWAEVGEVGEVHYPTLDAVLDEAEKSSDVSYPDLSKHRPLPEPPTKQFHASSAEASVPGTFTFRSDHTIRFGSVSPGFGTTSGQASVRQVRPSMPTVSCPAASVLYPEHHKHESQQENEAPRTKFVTPAHGAANKKRNRVSTDEEDAEQEAAARAAKKRRHDAVPEGDALLAPARVDSAGKKLASSPRRIMSPGTQPHTKP